MPRPSKQIHRQKIAAGAEWKKGNRKEAIKIWADADKARKEMQAKKHNKKKPAAEAGGEGEAAEEAAGGESEG